MSRRKLQIFGVLMAALLLAAGFILSKPVWFSVSSDDIGSRFKYTIFNPFRNQESEKSAERFLNLLRENPCSQINGLTQQSEEHRRNICERESEFRLKKWLLQYREDSQGKVILDYRTWRTSTDQKSIFIGEPLLLFLESQNGKWVVTGFAPGY